MSKRKITSVIDYSDDDFTSQSLIRAKPPLQAEPALTRVAKTKLLDNPTWNKKKSRVVTQAKNSPAPKKRIQGKPPSQRYPAASMVDSEDEEGSEPESDVKTTFNHFDDELDTAGDMDALNDYDLEELGEIERECEADTYESDDAALNNLDDVELAALLEAEELKAARLVAESSAKALLLKPIATKKSTRPGWIDSDIIPKQAKSNIGINTTCHGNPRIMAQPPGGYAAWTNLNYDAQDTSRSNLLLNSQDDRVKKVIQHSFIFLWASFTWIDAYPDLMAIVEYLRKALLKAAMHLKVNEMVDRLSNDAEYGMALSGLLSARISAWRVQPKKNAVLAVATNYRISRNNVNRTAAWLKELAYIYCGDVADDSKKQKHSLDPARPYENPLILAVLEQCFFTGPASIGARLPSKFKSSRSDRPDEKEIPIPMLALVATGVYAAIKEWECSPHIKADFGSNIFENTYRRHVDFLRKILKDGPNKYHAMMHRIYVETNGRNVQTEETQTQFSAFFDMSKMADD
ncbi:hypothetical protein F5148DRAFT_1369187 [Russula earlei]|uniref:Uncharacterized protein n=1 Tax=Russula earlei TaxID=71964 RepID=A0ACC0U391_9AGAM|nr:hypothetical protein F5148DRAFT_1369187 [Russula earlei]